MTTEQAQSGRRAEASRALGLTVALTGQAVAVTMLNALFSEFDRLAAKHGVAKIKTVGDAYMAASGLPEPRPDHVTAALALAVDMLAAASACRGILGHPVRLRVGVNTGPVVAGVIRLQRLIYDVWGDAVNPASRMESTGIPGHIQVTQAVRDQAGDQFRFTPRQLVPVKGKGASPPTPSSPTCPSQCDPP